MINGEKELENGDNHWEKSWKTHFEPAMDFLPRYILITWLVKILVAAISLIFIEQINLNNEMTYFWLFNSVMLFSFFVGNFTALSFISKFPVKGKKFLIIDDPSVQMRAIIKILKLSIIITLKVWIISFMIGFILNFLGYDDSSSISNAFGIVAIGLGWFWGVCFPSNLTNIKVEFLIADGCEDR